MTTGPAPGRAADRVRAVFFGSGSFAVPSLDALAGDPRVDLVGIVTAPDHPAGRGRTMLPTPVAPAEWPATGRETTPQLEAFAAREAATLLVRTLDGWVSGEIRPEPQPADGATITKRLRRADGRLDPARPAAELERHVRAYLPWPGSMLETPAGRLVVHKASVVPTEPGDVPGSLVAQGDGLALTTGDGRLVLDEVQLPGRRPLGGPEFLRGQRDLLGAQVGSPSAVAAAR